MSFDFDFGGDYNNGGGLDFGGGFNDGWNLGGGEGDF